jgi:hypothetical protein
MSQILSPSLARCYGKARVARVWKIPEDGRTGPGFNTLRCACRNLARRARGRSAPRCGSPRVGVSRRGSAVTVGLDVIDHLTGGRIGTFDIPCPTCGPYKRSARNQRRPVLRVYRLEPNFAGYHCARCGDKGAALHRSGTPPDPMKLAKARAEAAERERIVKADRLGLARWLWAKRKPISGSIAEIYLRSARGYGGRLPETLGFLPGRGDHPPAMIAAFGMAIEPDEPGKLAIGHQRGEGCSSHAAAARRLRQGGVRRSGRTSQDHGRVFYWLPDRPGATK